MYRATCLSDTPRQSAAVVFENGSLVEFFPCGKIVVELKHKTPQGLEVSKSGDSCRYADAHVDSPDSEARHWFLAKRGRQLGVMTR